MEFNDPGRLLEASLAAIDITEKGGKSELEKKKGRREEICISKK